MKPNIFAGALMLIGAATSGLLGIWLITWIVAFVFGSVLAYFVQRGFDRLSGR